MSNMIQHVDIPGHGRFEFDPDIYATIWNEHYSVNERELRDVVLQESGLDTLRLNLTRFEMIGMLADFETARRGIIR